MGNGGGFTPSQMNLDDAAIVATVLNGDVEAFSVIVSRYEKRVFNLAYRYTGDRQEAEDLSQEIFLRIFRALKTFRGDALFSTWLYRVATNVCLDALRRKKNRPEPVLEQPLATESGDVEKELVSPDLGPDHQVEMAESLEIIRKEIAQLQEPFRTAIILRDLQDLSYEEIAEVLNVSQGTVKSRLHRARAMLRKRLLDLELLSPDHVKQSRAEKSGGGVDRGE